MVPPIHLGAWSMALMLWLPFELLLLFMQEWNVKPRRGKQRKYWCKVVDNLFSSLGLDKAEWLEDIRKGSCSLKSFLGVAREGIDKRECSKFDEGLVKLSLYRTSPWC